jgi:hypothetical protein
MVIPDPGVSPAKLRAKVVTTTRCPSTLLLEAALDTYLTAMAYGLPALVARDARCAATNMVSSHGKTSVLRMDHRAIVGVPNLQISRPWKICTNSWFNCCGAIVSVVLFFTPILLTPPFSPTPVAFSSCHLYRRVISRPTINMAAPDQLYSLKNLFWVGNYKVSNAMVMLPLGEYRVHE